MLLEISFQFTSGTIPLVSLKSASHRLPRWFRWSAMWETEVRSLGQEYPLEKRLATHSSILAWRIPWTEEPGRLLFKRSQRVRHEWVANTHTEKRIPQKLANAAISPCFLSGWLIVKHCPAYQHSRLCLCLYFWCLFLSSFQASASLFLLFPYWPVISQFLCV